MRILKAEISKSGKSVLITFDDGIIYKISTKDFKTLFKMSALDALEGEFPSPKITKKELKQVFRAVDLIFSTGAKQ